MAYDAQAFASGQSASGNGVMDMLGQQMAGLQVQNAGLQQQAARQQMAMQRIALQRQQQYTQDVSSFAQNPTVNGLASLWKYPEFQASTKGIYDAMDPRMRQAEATQLGSFASVLQNAQQKDGTYSQPMLKQAADIVQQRIEADKAAGRDTTDDERALSMVQSGDPKQINAVKAMTAGLIAGAVGFDKAGDYLKAVGFSQEPVTTEPGKTVTNPLTGGVVASQPSLNTSVIVKNQDQSETPYSFNPNPGAGGGSVGTGTAQTGGGGPASGGGAVAGGMQASIAHAIHNEGRPGNSFNPKDANGSPTNWGINFKANQAVLAKMGITAANFKDLTQQQAEQIYATKYWPQSGAAKLPANMQAPYFDVYIRNGNIAKMAWKQSGGDPAKFMQIANAKFQAMASNPNSGTAPYKQAWANRDAGNLAIATGGNAGAPTATPTDAQGSAPNAPSAAPQVGAPQPTNSAFQPLLPPHAPGLSTQGAEQGHAWNAQHTAQVTVPGTDADPAQYAAEIDPAARNWIFRNEFPTGAGGMGGGGTLTLGEKNAIVKRAMQLWTAAGHSPEELKTVRSQYAGLNSSLQTATQTLSALTAAQDGLQRDANLVLTTHRALADVAPNNPNGMGIVKDKGPAGGLISNSTVNNAKLDWYETHGTPQQQAAVKAYKDAVNAYAVTYGKFMSAANGIGGSAPASDAARNQAGELSDEGLGPTALRAHLQTVLAEANNKRQGWQHQVDLVSNKLNSLGNLPSGAQAPQAPANIPQGAVQYLKSNPTPQVRQFFDQKYGPGKASQILGH